MSAKNHPAYKEELQRLNYTLEYVEQSLSLMTARKSKLDNDIERGKRHYSSESSQSYIDLMIGSMLQDRADVKLRNLVAARSKPYFARVDFKEKEKDNSEKLYIGKMALIREEDQELIIVDWRAPVANLYYEERLGDAHYYSPEGDVEGQLLVKRQFSINEGKLEEMFDIDITTSDEFLQASLGSSADNRLKEIVSTIQAEQNRVIRADMWKPLIVQGAAGGGKTTIALHRIAYLIYTHEKSFKPENFMIIAPSKLFLNY
ncbi:MAG: helicase, partial [Clostridia bacterium]|nr:helicase [Clostridia bacterium]